jgi:hypothetical protein
VKRIGEWYKKRRRSRGTKREREVRVYIFDRLLHHILWCSSAALITAKKHDSPKSLEDNVRIL